MTSDRSAATVRLTALGLLGLTFGAGLLSEAAVSALAQPPRPAAEEMSAVVSLDDLGLSEGQRRTIDELLAAKQPQTDAIVEAALRDLQVIVDSLDVEVRAVLSPEQTRLYDRLREAAPGIRAVRRIMTTDGEALRVDTLGVQVP